MRAELVPTKQVPGAPIRLASAGVISAIDQVAFALIHVVQFGSTSTNFTCFALLERDLEVYDFAGGQIIVDDSEI
jgi:hypothetical protein